MAKILIVHGIGNQYVGERELRAAWYPALCDGLLLAGVEKPPAEDDCVCPFYGDIFRPGAALSLTAEPNPEDLENATEEEIQLLQAIWDAAVKDDATVPNPASYAHALFRSPRIAEIALNALSSSKYLTDYVPLRFFGDLTQVVQYLDNRELRRKVLDRVVARIDPDTRIVIGHSLGSVVAYEALFEKPEEVKAFITIGSPLGMRNVVFDKLTPPPLALGVGHWPGHVVQWTNIAAKGDIVAAQKELAPLFGKRVDDVPIDSGWDAHSSTRYLNTVQAGIAIAHALAL